MKTSELDYELPPELIAQRPARRGATTRGCSSTSAATGDRRHRRFARPARRARAAGALVVVNDTRVVPARLRVRRPGGGEAEVLLLERLDGEPLAGARAPVAAAAAGHRRLGPVELLEEHRRAGAGWSRSTGEPAGEMPLPPYIREPLADPERYQTVYARDAGSAAAPTAGLHFTPGAARPARRRARDAARRPRHVPAGRARTTLEAHALHGERYRVEPAAWERIQRRCARVVAVGTTTVRVLETLAARRAARGAHRAVRDARASGSGASMRSSRTSTCPARACSRS